MNKYFNLSTLKNWKNDDGMDRSLVKSSSGILCSGLMLHFLNRVLNT